MTTTPENSIVFRKVGGHAHDGATSSLIDVSKYSLFDFLPIIVETSSTTRGRYQTNNRDLIKNFIIQTVEERVLNPQGIAIRANAITAREIAGSTITSDNLTANLVMVNNIIRSNNFNGAFFSNGALSNAGTTGWAISNTGVAIFSNAILRGNITANSGSVGGWLITTTAISAGSTSLYSNGHIVIASGTFNGEIEADSGNIGGWSINSNNIAVNSTALYSNGDAVFGNTTIHSNGQINNDTFTLYANGDIVATAGTFSGSLSGANISGAVGTFTGAVLVDDNSGNGIEITADGYIRPITDGAGVRFKYANSSVGTTVLYGNNINTSAISVSGTITGDELSISNGSDELSVDPSASFITDIIQFSSAAADSPIRIQRSGETAASRHITFSKSDGTYVGSIRYRSNTNNIMVFEGDITGTSDVRLKQNIVTFTNGLNIIKNITPVEFSFISSPESREHGFIAQDLYEIYPMAVEEGGDDCNTNPWRIMPTRLIPVLTACIKELIDKIDNIENRLDHINEV